MTISSGAVGKCDQTQAAQVSRLVVGGKGTGKQGLGVERFRIIEMRLTVLVTQRCHVGLVIDQDGEMHHRLRMPICTWDGWWLRASNSSAWATAFLRKRRQHIIRAMVSATCITHGRNWLRPSPCIID